jgi:hypothetical protein
MGNKDITQTAFWTCDLVNYSFLAFIASVNLICLKYDTPNNIFFCLSIIASKLKKL